MSNQNIRNRANEQIRGVREVKLIDSEGKFLGTIPFFKALEQAKFEGLDLVEVNRNAFPPTCKIMDFGKYKYEQEKAQKEAKKNQKNVTLKEVVLRPVTDTHDVQVKAKHVKEWLADGDKVKITVKMRGRERVHPDQGIEIINKLLSEVGSYKLESSPRLDGKFIVAMIAP